MDAVIPDKITSGTFRGVLEASNQSLNTATVALIGLAIVAVASRRGRTATLAAMSMVAAPVVTEMVVESVLVAVDPLGAENQRDLGIGYFPSGHAAAAMALVLTSVYVVASYLRTVLAITGAVSAALVGMGMLVTHAHHPSDIVAGYLIAMAWAAAVIATLPSTRADGWNARVPWQPLAAALVVPALAVTGFAIERPGDQAVSVGFIAVAVGVMMMPMVLVGAFVGLVGRADGQIRQLPKTVG
ncbi:MAG: phosphatase PAP2 family protein [Gemmatimonadota bacterium]|nr:phosphatase PAP2 family protein [Gemmatimonadota bacterium]